MMTQEAANRVRERRELAANVILSNYAAHERIGIKEVRQLIERAYLEGMTDATVTATEIMRSALRIGRAR